MPMNLQVRIQHKEGGRKLVFFALFSSWVSCARLSHSKAFLLSSLSQWLTYHWRTGGASSALYWSQPLKSICSWRTWCCCRWKLAARPRWLLLSSGWRFCEYRHFFCLWDPRLCWAHTSGKATSEPSMVERCSCEAPSLLMSSHPSDQGKVLWQLCSRRGHQWIWGDDRLYTERWFPAQKQYSPRSISCQFFRGLSLCSLRWDRLELLCEISWPFLILYGPSR